MSDGVEIKHARKVGGRLYAAGHLAKGQCPILGDVVPYREMVRDWRGVWVCRDALDPRHPLDTPTTFQDAEALQHPRPLLDEGTTDAVTQLVDEEGFDTTFGPEASE